MAIRVSSRWRSNWSGDGLARRRLLAGALGLTRLEAAREAEIHAFDLSLLDEPVTHNDLFFIREHFPAPTVSLHDWKLAAPGGVARNYEQLSAMALRTLPATLECAENPASGGLVSHSVWEGVSFRDLVKPASAGAWVRFSGRDGFSRTIPLEKAMHPDTLLVLRMNGSSLPPSHGGPVRLLVPGWYGMASVKWLERVDFVEAPADGKDYMRRTRSLFGDSAGDPVQQVLVKSAFARPIDGAILTGRRFTLRGVAWAGEGRIAKVEVSADNGKTWMQARLGASAPYCWALWQSDWKIPGPGAYTLAVRASDDKGNAQPAERDGRRSDPYEQNAIQRIQVEVR